MRIQQMSEWTRLGERLADLSPEKFLEILDALRDCVSAHDLMSSSWGLKGPIGALVDPAEA